jgi:hypothetical protein
LYKQSLQEEGTKVTDIASNGLELELMPGAMTIVLPETIDDEQVGIVKEGNRITISWSSILDRRMTLSDEERIEGVKRLAGVWEGVDKDDYSIN